MIRKFFLYILLVSLVFVGSHELVHATQIWTDPQITFSHMAFFDNGENALISIYTKELIPLNRLAFLESEAYFFSLTLTVFTMVHFENLLRREHE